MKKEFQPVNNYDPNPLINNILENLDSACASRLLIHCQSDISGLFNTSDRNEQIQKLSFALSELITNSYEKYPDGCNYLYISYDHKKTLYTIIIFNDYIYEEISLKKLILNLNQQHVISDQDHKAFRKLDMNCCGLGVNTARRAFIQYKGNLQYLSHQNHLYAVATFTQDGYDNPQNPPEMTLDDY